MLGRLILVLAVLLLGGNAYAGVSVKLLSPVAGSSYASPGTIGLQAGVTLTGGSQVARVEFYEGSRLLGSVSSAPYQYAWPAPSAGSYSLTAKAIDTSGQSSVSAAVGIVVKTGGMSVYYLHSDHLNTPRLVTDERNVVVWRFLPGEPFGASAPEEDPDRNGMPFVMNLRFPGQYFDKETNFHYNYYRDYDPNTGRYIQSDPIGLQGGINTYGYVEGNPVSKVDPLGLAPGEANAGGKESESTQCGESDCNQTFLACMAQCVSAYDPLNDESKIGLTAVGGTFPKSWVGLPRGLGGASSMTTVPSATAHAMGGGGSGTIGGAARGLGRLSSPVWIGYGLYLFGIEGYCVAACSQNKCAH